MATELEDRLRADMTRFTAGMHVPRGMAQQAYTRHRRHRARLRVLTAAAAAVVLVAGGLAGAEAAGAFGSAPAAPAATPATTKLAAYVVQHVENALAPARVDNVIGYTRMVYPPGFALEPSPGGIGGPRGPASDQAGWSVGSTMRWQYRSAVELSAYSPAGQRVFDFGLSYSGAGATATAVLYGSRTWWTAPAESSPPSAGSGCTGGNSIRLSTGPGNGWPALIRSQLACGAFSVVGHQEVDGIDAIRIAGPVPGFTLWVNPGTYLPVQMTVGPVSISFGWLAPTAANLALLHLSVPAGFLQVPPPASHSGPEAQR